MLRISHLALLSILTLFSGCQRWSSSLERLQQTCGPELDTGRYRYVQATGPDGRVLDSQALVAARWTNAEGLTETLTVSKRGCVSLPMASGQLEVVSQNPALGLVKKWNMIEGAGFQTLPLLPFQEPLVHLECPVSGYFAADELQIKSNIVLQNNDNASLYRWEILAALSDATTLLAASPFGQAALNLVDRLPTRELQENRYQLKLRVYSLLDDFNPNLPPREKECPLTILRKKPQIEGELAQSYYVAAPESVLPLRAEPGSQLYVCREPNHDQNDLRGSCATQTAKYCQDSRNFELTTTLASEKLGFFRYYVRAMNAAGVLSDTRCIEVAVDRDPPRLKLSFNDESLNRPGSGPALPFRYYYGRVATLEDDATDTAFLEDNLECRLDFVNAKNAVSASEASFCRTDRCRLQLLDDWKPCDKIIEWYSNDDWDRMINSTMNLRVRTRDRLNRVVEDSLSLWMLDARFKLPLPRSEIWMARQYDLANDILNRIPDHSSWQAVAATKDETWMARMQSGRDGPLLLKLSRTRGTEIYTATSSSLPADATITDLFFDRDGRLWVGFAGAHGLARWDANTGRFTLVNSMQNLSLLNADDYPLSFVQDKSGAIWYKLSHKRIARVENDSIEVMSAEQITGIVDDPEPAFYMQGESSKKNILIGPRITSDGSVWLGVSGPTPMLLEYDGQNWKPHVLSAFENKGTYLVDFQWDPTQSYFVLAGNNGVFASWKDAVYTEMPGTGKGVAPVEILPLSSGNILVAGVSGIYFADSKSGWKDMSVENKVFDVGDKKDSYPRWRYLRQLGNGEIWYSMRSYSPQAATNAYALARNGKNQMYFNFRNSNIPAYLTTQVLEDRQGRFWLGTLNGLSLLQKDRWKTLTTDSERLRTMSVQQLLEDQLGNIWVCLGKSIQSSGILALIRNNRLVNVSDRLPEGFIAQRMAALDDGRVLFAGSKGLVEGNAQAERFDKRFRDDAVSDVAVSADGAVYILVKGRILRKTNLDDDSPWTEIGDADFNWTRIIPDPKGNVHARRTTGKFYRLVDNAWQEMGQNLRGAPKDLTALAFDRNGEAWFDSPRMIWHLQSNQWKSYMKDDLFYNDTLPDKHPDHVGHIMIDSYGRVLTGAGGPGLGLIILSP